MSALPSVEPSSVLEDQNLIQELSEKLAINVKLESVDQDDASEIAAGSAIAISAKQVLCRLPSGSLVGWLTGHPEQSAAHAETVLALQQSVSENEELHTEINALVFEVSRNFEELSLISMLATTSALPSSEDSSRSMIESWIGPLCDGVGAQSIAAVIADEHGQPTETIWSGEEIASQSVLGNLIASDRQATERQPIVVNEFASSELPTVSEYMLLECRCEGNLHGWLIALNRIDVEEDVTWAQHGFTTVQANLMDTVVNQLATQLNNIKLLNQKESLLLDMVRALVNALDARDPYTCGHSERVALFAKFLASAAGLNAEECSQIYLTGLLHDVGKIAIPDSVLLKPSKLSDEERDVIQTHPDSGWRILHGLDALSDVLKGVLYHHENFDGSGYPDRLKGESIPIDGRILAVCDAFDAMTSDRPYRRGMSVAKAAEILNGGAGKYWDPQLVSIFLENLEAVNEIRLNHVLRKPSQRQKSANGIPMTMALPVSSELASQ